MDILKTFKRHLFSLEKKAEDEITYRQKKYDQYAQKCKAILQKLKPLEEEGVFCGFEMGCTKEDFISGRFEYATSLGHVTCRLFKFNKGGC